MWTSNHCPDSTPPAAFCAFPLHSSKCVTVCVYVFRLLPIYRWLTWLRSALQGRKTDIKQKLVNIPRCRTRRCYNTRRYSTAERTQIQRWV